MSLRSASAAGRPGTQLRLALLANGRLLAALADESRRRYAIIEIARRSITAAVLEGTDWTQTEIETATSRWGAPAPSRTLVTRPDDALGIETTWSRTVGGRTVARGVTRFDGAGGASWTAQFAGGDVSGNASADGESAAIGMASGHKFTTTTSAPTKGADGSIVTVTTQRRDDGATRRTESVVGRDGSSRETTTINDAQGKTQLTTTVEKGTEVDSDGHPVDRTSTTTTAPDGAGGQDTHTESTYHNRDTGAETSVTANEHTDASGNLIDQGKSSYSTDGKNSSQTTVVTDANTGETTISTKSSGEDGTVYQHDTTVDPQGNVVSDKSTETHPAGGPPGGGSPGGTGSPSGGGEGSPSSGGEGSPSPSGGGEGSPSPSGGGEGSPSSGGEGSPSPSSGGEGSPSPSSGGEGSGGAGGGGMPSDSDYDRPNRPGGPVGSLLDRIGMGGDGDGGEGEGERPSLGQHIGTGIAGAAGSTVHGGWGDGSDDGPGRVIADTVIPPGYGPTDDWGNLNDPRVLIAFVAQVGAVADGLNAAIRQVGAVSSATSGT